jgi:hypothetical protein
LIEAIYEGLRTERFYFYNNKKMQFVILFVIFQKSKTGRVLRENREEGALNPPVLRQYGATMQTDTTECHPGTELQATQISR